MHLEELEKLENEYNIFLSEQDKLYIIANEHTLVIHKDGTYTLIKGHKIKDSCSGFKYIGVHSIEGKKKVDLNDHSLKGENLLGSIYGVEGDNICNTVITEYPEKFIVTAVSNEVSSSQNFMTLTAQNNTTIPTIITIIERDGIENLLKVPKEVGNGVSNSYIYIWPGLYSNNYGPDGIIQPVLWKGKGVATWQNSRYLNTYPNYIWIYDSSLNKNITSMVWHHKTVDEYDIPYYIWRAMGMNLHVVKDGKWCKYNSYDNSNIYLKENSDTNSWYLNSQYIVSHKKYYTDGSTAQFYIISRDIIKIPQDCSKIIFKMDRYSDRTVISATVIDNKAPAPHPTTTLTIKEYYDPSTSGGKSMFTTRDFSINKIGFDYFNTIVPLAIESNVPKDVDKLAVYFNVSGISDANLIVENTNTINTICKAPPPECGLYKYRVSDCTLYTEHDAPCNALWQVPGPWNQEQGNSGTYFNCMYDNSIKKCNISNKSCTMPTPAPCTDGRTRAPHYKADPSGTSGCEAYKNLPQDCSQYYTPYEAFEPFVKSGQRKHAGWFCNYNYDLSTCKPTDPCKLPPTPSPTPPPTPSPVPLGGYDCSYINDVWQCIKGLAYQDLHSCKINCNALHQN